MQSSFIDTPVVETMRFLRTGFASAWMGSRSPAASHFGQAIPDCRSVPGFRWFSCFIFCFTLDRAARLRQECSTRRSHPDHAGFRAVRMVNLPLTLLSSRLLSVLMKAIITHPSPSCKSNAYALDPVFQCRVCGLKPHQITSIVSAVFKIESQPSHVARIHHVVACMMPARI